MLGGMYCTSPLSPDVGELDSQAAQLGQGTGILFFHLFFSLGRRRRRELGLDATVPNQWYGKAHLPPQGLLLLLLLLL